MKKILFILLQLIFFNSYSQAVSDTTSTSYSKSSDSEDFQFVTQFTSGEKVFVRIDESEIDENGAESIKVWIRFVYPFKSKKNKKGKLILSGGNYDLIHIEVHCQKKMYDFDKAIKYNSRNEVINNNKIPEYSVSIIPGSLFDYVRKYVCN